MTRLLTWLAQSASSQRRKAARSGGTPPRPDAGGRWARLPRCRPRWIALLAIAVVGVNLPIAVAETGMRGAVAAVTPPGPGRQHQGTSSRDVDVPPVRVKDPDKALGKGWKASPDRAVTAVADVDGLKLLVADSRDAYAWRTAAVLSEPGLGADSWIGNQCSMDSDHVAVVYAPRSFTNKPDLMQGGGFAAIVNLKSRAITKLPFNVSLAAFDPGCNRMTGTAVFTAYRGMDTASSTKSRIITVANSGHVIADTTEVGELSSAVPTPDGVIADRDNQLIRVNPSGSVDGLVKNEGVSFDLSVEANGFVAYIERVGDTEVRAKVWKGKDQSDVVAAGALGDLALKQGRAAIFLTGHPSASPKLAGSGVKPVTAPAAADVSSDGRLAITSDLAPGIRAGLDRIADAGKGASDNSLAKGTRSSRSGTAADEPGQPGTLVVTSVATSTGVSVRQSVQASARTASAVKLSPSLAPTPAAGEDLGSGSVSHDPTDPERWCAVSRNDVNAQALQPTPNQVEWAVDMAVRGDLRADRINQGGFRNQTGLSTIDPQGLFPAPALLGGGRVPANILLGILAQESNLWQAESGAIPGQMGNPLAAVAGYYGRDNDAKGADFWRIHWGESDCGYGVGQITDGMRVDGHAAPGVPNLPLETQRAVALDYATNIAAALKIVADKWNEIHQGPTISVNDDNPARMENWYAAVWNYNEGFNSFADASSHDGHWGLGWLNNPANPMYEKGWGHPFMNTDVDPLAVGDAANPQYWPYQEKVLGWAAWSIDAGYSYATSGRQDWPGEAGYATAGFRPAYWNGVDGPADVAGTGEYNRATVSPPLSSFCNSVNNCDSGDPPHCPDEACYTQYWWTGSNVTWKTDCDQTCGRENIKYQTLINEPGRGYRLQYGEPVCTGAPANSYVVASAPAGTETFGDCGPISSAGSFQFSFTSDGDGNYEAREDLYQIGGGYGGHFWYAHARDTDHLGGDGGVMAIDGTWTLGRDLQWARVLVQLPDTGAQTRQAKYQVLGSDSSSPDRAVEQRASRWVSLGVFHFVGVPRVKLSNSTPQVDPSGISVGTADEDVAWGAVAFQSVPSKPRDSVVAMGDSYSSGEGAVASEDDYYPETDYRKDPLLGSLSTEPQFRDACHRSRYAWSRQATIPGRTESIGDLDNQLDAGMDYHLIACSGAETYNIDGKVQDQAGELPQVDQGYLDQNTTLVTLSIGGNDAHFGDIMQKCLAHVGSDSCQHETFDTPDAGLGGLDSEFVGEPLETAIPAIIDDIVLPHIVKELRLIHQKAPNAKIVLMGYPALISNGGSCLSYAATVPSGGQITIGLNSLSAQWMNSMAPKLASAMQEAADETNADIGGSSRIVWFSDPGADFAGKGICGDPEQINGIIMTLTRSDEPWLDWPLLKEFGISNQSCHPKISGARTYADVLQRTLGEIGL